MQSPSSIDDSLMDLADTWQRRDAERRERARAAVARRDMVDALDAMEVGREHCFVWPETYPTAYHYQRLDWCRQIDGFPIVMRAAKTSIYTKYGKGAYCIRVAERFITRHKVTALDNARDVARDLLRAICAKHELNTWQQRMWAFLDQFDGVALVAGRAIPVSQERMKVLAKSMALVEKIDRLAGVA